MYFKMINLMLLVFYNTKIIFFQGKGKKKKKKNKSSLSLPVPEQSVLPLGLCEGLQIPIVVSSVN